MPRTTHVALLIFALAAAPDPAVTADAQETAPLPRRVTAAGTHRSPEVARRLAVDWYDAIQPAPKAGQPASKASADPKLEDRLPLDVFRKQVRRKRLRPRPAVVHVFDPTFKMGEVLRLERSVFGTEALLIGCRFVDNFRLKERPGVTAGFWVADADGRIATRLPLNPSRREMETALAKVFARHYEGTLAAVTTRYAAWLEQLEAAEDTVAREHTPAAAVALVRARRGEKEILPKRRKRPDPAQETPPAPAKR